MARPLKHRNEQKMDENANQIQAQMMRGLRYFIVLNLLKNQPMHGYGIITLIRKKFGTYLGPSSIYPLLNDLEDWNYLESTWETKNFHPKRIYNLTIHGHKLLDYLECMFGSTLRRLDATKSA